MLVNSYEMLDKAKKNNSCVFHFNINNLEWTRIILEKCNKEQIDVILGVSEGAIKYMGGYFVVASLVTSLIYDLNITNNVCLHLDHGSSYESCEKAINAGFTSVMIDASKYPYEENVRITKEAYSFVNSSFISLMSNETISASEFILLSQSKIPSELPLKKGTRSSASSLHLFLSFNFF